MKINSQHIDSKLSCYHCGDECHSNSIRRDDKIFCCNGCKSVFEILYQNNLCTYYDLNENPGIVQKQELRKDKFAFLDDDSIKSKLIQFTNGKQTQLTLYLPQIHCSSCLWLLENIQTINEGIINSNVNFSKKEVFLSYDESKTNLREVVETLTQIGYEPHLSLNDLSEKDLHKIDRTRWYKIGIAGFCFANIMMMSFAEYLSFANHVESNITTFFKSLSVILSLPVLFYSANEFFISAWSGLKNKYLNIDLPVALALIITFSRSIYEILTGVGAGYLDSFSGIVFFMLIGRWLQARTYRTISFDRDYKSFFPIALNVVKDNNIIATEISKIKVNDVVQIHSNEIIPVDSILSKGKAEIDYSFVSGESLPVNIQVGEMIYAGGKQLGSMIELVVVKEVSQSYLTNLWNNPVFKKHEKVNVSLYDTIGKYFTYVVLLIGIIAGMYWGYFGKTTLMWNAITTVLIVACPCALLLSQNYANGNILRLFGLNKFYLRSPDLIEQFSKINHIVFDKTGTLTQAKGSNVRYNGKVIQNEDKILIASLAKQSSHPASKLLYDYFNFEQVLEVNNFKEIQGKGIEGWIQDKHIKIGSEAYIGAYISDSEIKGTKVFVSIDGNILGVFVVSNKYRFGIANLLSKLKKNFSLSLISGDNDNELKNIETILGSDSEVLFNQSPQQKLEYIQSLQTKHNLQVMMVGDGLNDSGALKQSNIGIAVADTTNTFTPSSDCIIEASSLNKLDKFIQLAKDSKNIILLTFIISAIYNVIGLYYSVQGVLSPVIAAILMPSSSITIILLTYGLTELLAKKHKLKTINE